EPRSARADGPGGRCDGESRDLGYHCVGVGAATPELLGHDHEVARVRRMGAGLQLGDLVGRDADRHEEPPGGQRRKADATPPSTGTASPVVREKAPDVSAKTASAMWAGSTSRRRSVRPA